MTPTSPNSRRAERWRVASGPPRTVYDPSHSPALGGSRSPDGWDQIPRWAGGWVLHQPPWSFGFDSQTRGTRGNRAPPCVKAPGSSRVPPPREQLYNRTSGTKNELWQWVPEEGSRKNEFWQWLSYLFLLAEEPGGINYDWQLAGPPTQK